MTVTRPDAGEAERTFSALADRAQAMASAAEALALAADWEVQRRRIETWRELAELRFRQDALDEDRRDDARFAGELSVITARYDTAIKRALTSSAHRPALEQWLGSHVLSRWENDLRSFADGAADALLAESDLANEYTALLAAARTTFRGAPASLGDLARFAEDAARETRREACVAGWSILHDNRDRLDALFDRLVQTRAAIAAQLGYRRFNELAYHRRGRIDYGAPDVAVFRDEIRRCIVPLAGEIVRNQAAVLGTEEVMPWDARLFDARGPMAFAARPDALLASLCDVLTAVHPDIGAFTRAMIDERRYDLDDRPGKAVGAFCTSFPSDGTAFVFAKLSGTSADIGTLVHETGHAFQVMRSREKPVMEYITASAETGEIHSMGLEFLAWPHYERFFAADADRFRSRHLRTMLTMLPYIAVVDEFQELVYAQPHATPADRNAMWLSLEQHYMPWLRHGDIAHLANGGRWQRQPHVYAFPFYYIDYGLAMCCALQLWAESRTHPAAAIERYLRLCDLGGELPFRALLDATGLRSPFEAGTLENVAAEARRELRLVA